MKNYPKSSGTHKQERRSIRAFNNVVTEEMFIVRSEREDDYGVDMSLELVFDTTAVTNIRSQVQIKSDTDGHRNQDGSYSYPVPIVTINYLMNQLNSLFVVYVENEQILLWEWITKIIYNAMERGIDIRITDQKTISYRFSKVLNEENLKEIHSTMLKNGRLVREFSELTTFAAVGPVKATIDLEKSKIITSEECETLIKQYGVWLVNQGRYSDIQVLEDGLNMNTRTSPEVAAVLAYGKFHSGNYYEALALVPKGRQMDLLPNSLKDIAAHLRVHVSFILGIIDATVYLDQLVAVEAASPESILSLQTKMYRLREELYTADRTNVEVYAKLTKELRVLLQEIKAKAVDSFELFIRIELFEWELEGFNLLSKIMTHFFLLRGREKIGHPLPDRQRIEIARETIIAQTKWVKKYHEMENRGWKSEGIAAFAYLCFAQLQLLMMASFRALGLSSKEQDSGFLIDIKERLIIHISKLEKEGNWLQSLRAKIALAETEVGLGSSERANRLSKQVLEFAEMYGAKDMIQRAQRIIGGKTVFGIVEIANKQKTTDEHLMELSDDEIPMYARQLVQMLGIPSERLSNLEIEYRWLREDAIERQNHCKYIHVLQDLRHSQQLETSYNVNPVRRYMCEYFGHISQNVGTDRDYLLINFKSKFCLGCTYKKPNR